MQFEAEALQQHAVLAVSRSGVALYVAVVILWSGSSQAPTI